MQYHNVRVESAQALEDLVSSPLSPILLAVDASVLKFPHYHSQFLVQLQRPQPSAFQHLPQTPLLLPLLVQSFAAKKKDTISANSKPTKVLSNFILREIDFLKLPRYEKYPLYFFCTEISISFVNNTSVG